MTNAQQRLDKYMTMRENVYQCFLSNPEILSIATNLIGKIEVDIRACRKELGLPEWGYK